MATINNPIIPGMAPDPSILRVGEKYFIATSTFHWTPPVQIFESDDLCNWKLAGHGLVNHEVDLRGTNTPAGIWAPHLSCDEQREKYWLTYSLMVNMAGREFCADTYTMSADSPTGPWSAPIYLTSIGFDPALFHDEDGKHYCCILEWESRDGYQTPGHIVVAEVDLSNGEILGGWHRVTQGFTTRGCAEAPQLYKHDGYYYLLIAAGGTGYGHGVEIGRSRNVFGPYEPHPSGEPIITSSPRHLFSLGDPDAGQFHMFNPASPMQKAGHGSLVHTHTDEWYVAHLMSRPLPGTQLNPLGRETSLQKMRWTADGWLEMEDGSNLAKMEVSGPAGVESGPALGHDVRDDFDRPTWDVHFLSPYRDPDEAWVSTTERPHHLRIHGGDSLFSQINPSVMATCATSFRYELTTHVEFHPRHYSEQAGAGLYYDSNNWIFARLYHSEQLDSTVLSVLQAKLGQRSEYPDNIVPIASASDSASDSDSTSASAQVELRLSYSYGVLDIYYREEPASSWQVLKSGIDASYLSDEGVNGEPGEIGGFTGLMNFIGSVDSHQRTSFADFSYYSVINEKN